MKNRINTLLAILVIALFTITSCVDREIDPPTFTEKDASDTATGTVITIQEFKDLAEVAKGSVYELDTNLFVRGVVIGNGVSGNLYKKMYIQDIGIDQALVRGLEISIDKTSLFTFYPVGQIVYLRCKGFYLGNYDGYEQFGYIDETGGPGRIPTQLVDSAILIDGLPLAANIPEPKTVNGAAGFTVNDVSRLVKITNVFFQDAGNLYANQDEAYPERIVEDANGNIMTLSTSTYAKFAADTIPSGFGDIQGILSLYNGENRLYIRGLDDVMMYNMLIAGSFDTEADTSGWTRKNISGDAEWEYNTFDNCMKITGWTGSGSANEDYLISPAFDLSSSTNPSLSFSTRRLYADSGESNPLEILISTDYTGDVTTATWNTISGAILDLNEGNTYTGWVSSGPLDLSTYTGTNVRVAFKYKSSGTGNGTASYWDIDNINVMDN